jgi:hypothetical protein
VRRHHRRQRQKSLQGFHPELTEHIVVAACPPTSPKPCKPCNTPPHTTNTTTGDRTASPHAALLPAKRAHAAAATRKHAHPGLPPRHPLLRREHRHRRRRPDATSRTLSGATPRPTAPSIGSAAVASTRTTRNLDASSTAEHHAGRRPCPRDGSGPPGPDLACAAEPEASCLRAQNALRIVATTASRPQGPDGRRPTAGAVAPAAVDEIPSSPAITARRREEKGPAAAAPTGLCPAEATGDGKGGRGGGGGPVVWGIRRRPCRPWGERRGGPSAVSFNYGKYSYSTGRSSQARAHTLSSVLSL